MHHFALAFTLTTLAATAAPIASAATNSSQALLPTLLQTESSLTVDSNWSMSGTYELDSDPSITVVLVSDPANLVGGCVVYKNGIAVAGEQFLFRWVPAEGSYRFKNGKGNSGGFTRDGFDGLTTQMDGKPPKSWSRV